MMLPRPSRVIIATMEESIGKVMYQTFCHLDAPSKSAASNISWSMPASAER